ncbi:ABC-type metal ion transport system protein [Lacticaseibacillus brantae DSM 23927]|uniref:ABC-type metal ion transport system protein n=2 Tax=Lacticaseibacillus brantae TaxID=943673 RepID=A0A0R2AXY2_9LACO|nr:ABC-type metal ion transport system protein [Lacticaseibacillus brantae DSM 23927]
MHKKSWLVGLMSLMVMLLLAACGQKATSTASSNTSGKINVIASVDFYGEVAKAVLGDHGTVTSIIDNPDVDPHDYEPTTAVGKSVATANVVVANGIGYDGWMDKLVKAANNKVQYVRVGEDVMNKKEGDNEHLWYNDKTIPALANHLAKVYGKLDSKHAADYTANAKKYIASLEPLTKLIAELKTKSNGQKVDVSEPVFDNALDALGYKMNDAHFAKATEDGTDPSPADIAQIKADIKGKKIAFFVQNSQADSKLVDSLAAEAKSAGVPVLKVTETLPKGKTYLTWMLGQYQDLQKIQNK